MQLAAGQLTLQYENGFLRWITAGKDEVLRMIYFAVRDKNWSTVTGVVMNEKIERKENSFIVSYEMLFEQDEIKIHFHAAIEGKADNSIVFEITGTSVTAFKKNRIGFCILHPIKECIGQNVWITHSDKSIEENIFPVYISPQQPFKNIAAMQWQAGDNCKVLVEFEGDIFETEDHRNWTDNNYKTYCTPLELPFPVLIKEGDEVQQKITLKVDGDFLKIENDDVIEIAVQQKILPIPKIGVGRASERDENYGESLKLLSVTGFNHYRADIKLSDDNWKQTLQECFTETGLLNTKLEIALFVYAGCTNKIAELIDLLKDREDIRQIILLEEHAKCINNQLLKKLLLILKEQLPGLLVGGGTDAHFTELNRSHLDVQDLDFVSYSLNPQVHANDDASVMENAAAHEGTVITAKHKFKKPVYVSPVTLKMRYNTDSTDKGNEIVLPPADARQHTNFSAAWTLASLKSFIESDVSSVTYFETVGERGIAFYHADRNIQLFPVAHIFKTILTSGYTHILKSQSTNPFEVCSLAPAGKKYQHLLVANLTNTIKKIRIVTVDNYLASELITSEVIHIEKTKAKQINLMLAPFQIIILKPIQQLSDGKYL